MRNALYAGVLSLSLIACGGSKQTKPVTPANTQSVNAAAKKPSQDSDQPLSARGVKADGSTKTFAAIYFDYDSTTLNDDARNELSSMSEYLRSNQDATLVIEGHCDERGTTEYNLALGEGRARAARDYLVRLGVRDDRVDIMSYGKERPAVRGHGESAWAKNRRGELRPRTTKQ